jgi:hypothetical protein
MYLNQFQKIKDRFQIKISLTPENIDTVIKKRLLQKKVDKNFILRDLYSSHSGSLSTAALIKNLNLFTQLDQQQFVDSYPFMPYSIRLMQEIFGHLRSRGGASESLTGRERAVLQVVRSILVGVGESQGLSYAEIGHLATFDMVYDAINEELKIVRSEYQAVIEKEIAQESSVGAVSVASAAKSLFLLQYVSQWLPCTTACSSSLPEDRSR